MDGLGINRHIQVSACLIRIGIHCPNDVETATLYCKSDYLLPERANAWVNRIDHLLQPFPDSH